MIKHIIIVVILMASASSCYYDNKEELYPGQATCDTLNVSFAKDIKP